MPMSSDGPNGRMFAMPASALVGSAYQTSKLEEFIRNFSLADPALGYSSGIFVGCNKMTQRSQSCKA